MDFERLRRSREKLAWLNSCAREFYIAEDDGIDSRRISEAQQQLCLAAIDFAEEVDKPKPTTLEIWYSNPVNKGGNNYAL
jgi:hypothetical protein